MDSIYTQKAHLNGNCWSYSNKLIALTSTFSSWSHLPHPESQARSVHQRLDMIAAQGIQILNTNDTKRIKWCRNAKEFLSFSRNWQLWNAKENKCHQTLTLLATDCLTRERGCGNSLVALPRNDIGNFRKVAFYKKLHNPIQIDRMRIVKDTWGKILFHKETTYVHGIVKNKCNGTWRASATCICPKQFKATDKLNHTNIREILLDPTYHQSW